MDFAFWTHWVYFQLYFDACLMEMMQLVARQDDYCIPKNVVHFTNQATIITFHNTIDIAYSSKLLDEPLIQT